MTTGVASFPRSSTSAHVVPAWVWALAVWVGVAVYSAALTIESIRDHNAFATNFDTAVYDQLVWLLGHGYEPFSTVVSRPMLADHFQPAVFLLAPVGWLDLGVPGLFFLQSVGLALTAPALFALARASGATPGAASIPALLWLACPWVASVNLFEFHPSAFGPVLLVLAVLAAFRNQYWLLGVSTVLALSLKEDVALTFVVLGMLLMAKGKRRMGAILAVGSTVWFVAASTVIQSLGDSYATFAERYAGSRGGTIGDVIVWSLEHPLQLVSDVGSQSLPAIFLLVASTGALALSAPSWMLLAAPTALHNALSAYDGQHYLIHHYHLGTVAGLFVAAAIGVGRLHSLGRLPRRLAGVGLLTAAIVGLLGGIRIHADSANGVPLEANPTRALLRHIPPDASVAASRSLLPQLSERVEIYTLPEPFAPLDWGSPLTAAEFEERAEGVQFVAFVEIDDLRPFVGDEPPAPVPPLRPLLKRAGFVVIARGGHVEILERRE